MPVMGVSKDQNIRSVDTQSQKGLLAAFAAVVHFHPFLPFPIPDPLKVPSEKTMMCNWSKRFARDDRSACLGRPWEERPMEHVANRMPNAECPSARRSTPAGDSGQATITMHVVYI